MGLEVSDLLKSVDKKKIKDVSFVSNREKTHYYQLKESIENQSISPSQVRSMVCHMFANRQPMANVVTREVFWYSKMIGVFPCLRRKRDPDGRKKMGRAKVYKHAVRRYYKEMDVLNIVRTNRMMRLLMHTQLDKCQQILLAYQRHQVIESDTSDQDGSDINDLTAEISSQSELIGVYALGRKLLPSLMRYT